MHRGEAMTQDPAVLGGAWPEGFAADAGNVSEDEAVLAARAHAATTWAVPAAVGPVLHVFGVDGRPFAYVVPFALDAEVFPSAADLLKRIAALHREAGMEPEGRHWATPALTRQMEREFGRFGTVYVSAQRTRGPVLMTINTLPSFFFMADLASAALQRAADAGSAVADTRLGRLMFANPHEELVECTAGDRTLLLDADSMEFAQMSDYTEALGMLAAAGEAPDERAESAWEAVLAGPLEPATTADGEEAAADTIVTVPNPRRIPPVDWTYWCAATAWTMVLSSWDNFTPGAGTHLGYGKVVDFWFDHDPTMNNVPNLIDELIDKTKTPPTWAGDQIAIVNDQGYSFSTSQIACNAGNGWGWAGIKAEIDAGRPVLVGMWSKPDNGHAMVAYGYRIAGTGQRFLLLLSTIGDRWEQQSIQVATGMWRGLPLTRMSAERVHPGGGSGTDHLVLTRPGGGEKLSRLVPCDIVWYTWGASITRSRLSQSCDGGRTWEVIAADVPTTTGANSYRWVPQQQAARSRVRVEGFTAGGSLVAGDGSRQNVVIQTQPLNNWGGWLGLGRPGLEIDYMAAGRNADGRLELAVVTADGSVWHRYQAAPASQSWTGWASLGQPQGNTWIRMAEMAANADGRLEVIALGSDDALWHRWQPQPSRGPWGGWSSLGKPRGVALRRLAVDRNKDGRLQAFAIGDDYALWTSSQTAPGSQSWSGWSSLGGPGHGIMLLNVNACANTDGRIEVVVSGGTPSGSEFGLVDPRVWLIYQPRPNAAAPWSSCVDMGHPLNGAGLPAPVIRRNADGRLEIFAAGLGGALWHRWQPAAGQGPWSAWASRGRPGTGESLLTPLAVARSGDGRLQAFGVSLRTAPGGGLVSDCRHIWQTSANDGWSNWGGLGSPPARSVQWMCAVERQDGRLELFAHTAEDRAVWHNVQQ